MGPSGRVALAAGLWLLYTLGEAEDPGVPAPRRCLLSHYRSLDPRALAAAKALKDRYEQETLSWGPRTCSFRPRRDRPRPSSCAQLRHVARAIADSQAVLNSLRSPEPWPGLGATLELLAAAGRDVATCVTQPVPTRLLQKVPAAIQEASPNAHNVIELFWTNLFSEPQYPQYRTAPYTALEGSNAHGKVVLELP
ncbi:interferon lambda-4-like, partial [Tupaia chinensis]|uniref:interferon lambda-4-like n=1 Tax=Tupaia chinensis TaxID=246437 RepID=UPI0003C8F990